MAEFTVMILILTHSSSEMTPNLNPLSNFPQRIGGTTPRVQEIKHGGNHDRRAFPLLCPGYSYIYLLRTHKIYHLPNNQQQGCVDSLLVTGRGRRCYDDRSMSHDECVYGDRATLVK